MEKRTKLFSRKNKVHLVEYNEEKYVEKRFADKDKFKNELNYQKILAESSINIPKLHEYNIDLCLIRYEYVEGRLLSQILLDDNGESFEIMGVSLKEFHKLTIGKLGTEQIIIAGDVNLRNFIRQDKNIFYLDYEEYRLGQAHEDVSTFLSHLVSHREVSAKQRLAMGKIFLNSYYKDEDVPKNLTEDIITKAKQLAVWRKFDPLEEEIINIILELV